MLANLAPYAPIMRNWCVSSDPICAANQSISSYNEESHLNYYNVDAQDAATWIKSVASLTADSPRTTAIPTSLSGIIQNYATIGTATPSGSVTLDTTWTNIPSSVPCMPTATPSVNASTIAPTTTMLNSSIPLAPTPSSLSGAVRAPSQTLASTTASSAPVASASTNAGVSVVMSLQTLAMAALFAASMLLL